MDSVRTFRYGMSRAAGVMSALLLALIGYFVTQYVLLDLRGGDPETLVGLLVTLLVLGIVLVPVPVMEILWLVLGRVEVTSSGLRWRGWGGWNERAWSEILAVGMPAPDSRRQDDERIHVVTEDKYEFIHGFNLRDRERLRELLRSYGDLAEVEVIGRHTFLCRPGAGKLIRERAEREVDPQDDGIDFLAGRLRRF